jgi:hypothetical protein
VLEGVGDTMASERHDPVLRYVSPDVLQFDANNPRFGGALVGKTQDEIQKAIYGSPHFASELVDSFLENGYIQYEPLVVRPDGDRFIVIEGNRRLSAIKEILANEDKYKGRTSELKSIPVLVFPEAAPEDHQKNMRIYLGVRHLLGFREWPSLSKAQFLEREVQNAGSLDTVLKEMRITKQTARRFLIPYRLLCAAHFQLPPEEDFWMLGEALGRSGIKKFVQLIVNPKTLEVDGYNKGNVRILLGDLYGPAHGTRDRDSGARLVHDTRDLTTYSRILDSDKAAAALRKGKSLEEAVIYVDTTSENYERLGRLTRQMRLLVSTLTTGKKTNEGSTLQDRLKEFETAVKAFLKVNA